MKALNWINLLVGIWLIVSPFVLSDFKTNNILLGLIVGIVAAVLLAQKEGSTSSM